MQHVLHGFQPAPRLDDFRVRTARYKLHTAALTAGCAADAIVSHGSPNQWHHCDHRNAVHYNERNPADATTTPSL
jgi:hypothetical protein